MTWLDMLNETHPHRLPSSLLNNSFSERPTHPFIWCLVVFANLLSCLMATESQASSREYKLKAGMIYNMTQFTRWPDQKDLEAGRKPLNFCIAGQNPFGKNLKDMAREFKKENIQMKILLGVTAIKAFQCHILFLPKSSNSSFQEILSSVDRDPVLSIGESDGLAEKGAIINLIIVSNKIRFEINPCSLKSRRLWISTELINLARIIPCENLTSP